MNPGSSTSSGNPAAKGLAKLVPMAVRLVFGAMAHHGHRLSPAQLLDQPKCELLPVILDGPAPRVNGTVHEQLAAVRLTKLSPGDTAGLKTAEQLFAWPE
ncbi:MAG TPA: hypothetical protein VF424_05295 [Vicinamibacterales bacterium]